MSGFNGFDPAAIALLDSLPTFSAEEYGRKKATLSAGLTKPGGALIAEIAERLPVPLTTTARGSVSPLHRDLRFAPDRYKDHLLLTTWAGTDKKTSPILWVRIDGSQIGLASGLGFDRASRERWRAAIGDDRGIEFARHLDTLKTDRGAEIAGDQNKSLPKPFPPDHPRADLLRYTGFQVRFIQDHPASTTNESPTDVSVNSEGFVDWCVDEISKLLPIHQWLVAEIAQI